MSTYYRPLPGFARSRPEDAPLIAGGWVWFDQVEIMRRDGPSQVMSWREIPDEALAALTRPRANIAGVRFDAPRIMGILNVTPDSFSDGGKFYGQDAAVLQARAMVDDGADILDIGGESTRPGAETVPVDTEIARVAPVIEALSAQGKTPISIDTRKSAVAEAALGAGAALVNDVAGFTYDDALAPLCAARQVSVCVMHAQGDPATMQDAPRYDNVLLDIYDFLDERVSALTTLGIARNQIIVDPGIGFGKTLQHNLTILQNISLFHGLGCPVLLGASRKKFIGTISRTAQADQRMPGSVAVALHGIAQGVQIVRVHDVKETRQAIDLWRAVESGAENGA